MDGFEFDDSSHFVDEEALARIEAQKKAKADRIMAFLVDGTVTPKTNVVRGPGRNKGKIAQRQQQQQQDEQKGEGEKEPSSATATATKTAAMVTTATTTPTSASGLAAAATIIAGAPVDNSISIEEREKKWGFSLEDLKRAAHVVNTLYHNPQLYAGDPFLAESKLFNLIARDKRKVQKDPSYQNVFRFEDNKMKKESSKRAADLALINKTTMKKERDEALSSILEDATVTHQYLMIGNGGGEEGGSSSPLLLTNEKKKKSAEPTTTVEEVHEDEDDKKKTTNTSASAATPCIDSVVAATPTSTTPAAISSSAVTSEAFLADASTFHTRCLAGFELVDVIQNPQTLVPMISMPRHSKYKAKGSRNFAEDDGEDEDEDQLAEENRQQRQELKTQQRRNQQSPSQWQQQPLSHAEIQNWRCHLTSLYHRFWPLRELTTQMTRPFAVSDTWPRLVSSEIPTTVNTTTNHNSNSNNNDRVLLLLTVDCIHHALCVMTARMSLFLSALFDDDDGNGSQRQEELLLEGKTTPKMTFLMDFLQARPYALTKATKMQTTSGNAEEEDGSSSSCVVDFIASKQKKAAASKLAILFSTSSATSLKDFLSTAMVPALGSVGGGGKDSASTQCVDAAQLRATLVKPSPSTSTTTASDNGDVVHKLVSVEYLLLSLQSLLREVTSASSSVLPPSSSPSQSTAVISMQLVSDLSTAIDTVLTSDGDSCGAPHSPSASSASAVNLWFLLLQLLSLMLTEHWAQYNRKFNAVHKVYRKQQQGQRGGNMHFDPNAEEEEGEQNGRPTEEIDEDDNDHHQQHSNSSESAAHSPSSPIDVNDPFYDPNDASTHDDHHHHHCQQQQPNAAASDHQPNNNVSGEANGKIGGGGEGEDHSLGGEGDHYYSLPLQLLLSRRNFAFISHVISCYFSAFLYKNEKVVRRVDLCCSDNGSVIGCGANNNESFQNSERVRADEFMKMMGKDKSESSASSSSSFFATFYIHNNTRELFNGMKLAWLGLPPEPSAKDGSIEGQDGLYSTPRTTTGYSLIPFNEALTISPAKETAPLIALRIEMTPKEKLHTAQKCYSCRGRYTFLHPYYYSMCRPCSEYNYNKRLITRDLRGKVILLTGARIKIGYAMAISLLRCGATVIGTTRFTMDATNRFSSEPDYEEWKDRLHLYSVDLRDMWMVTQFCNFLSRKFTKLFAIINNAAQTIARTAAYTADLRRLEANPPQQLVDKFSKDASATEWRQFFFEHSSVTVGQSLHLEYHPTQTPVVEGDFTTENTQLRTNAVTGVVGASLKDARAFSAAAETFLSNETAEEKCARLKRDGGDAIGTVAMSDTQLALTLARRNDRYDTFAEESDKREKNSWSSNLAEVHGSEAAEVMAINALSPFILNSRLKPLLMNRDGDDNGTTADDLIAAKKREEELRAAAKLKNKPSFAKNASQNTVDSNNNNVAAAAASSSPQPTISNREKRRESSKWSAKKSSRFIINVSAMEGQFYRYKGTTHPHTNMAKAALNMMTRTSAEDYARDGIFMNSVDTGWITDESPAAIKQRRATDELRVPIDEVDAAARCLDLIYIDSREYGKFWKDYKVIPW